MKIVIAVCAVLLLSGCVNMKNSPLSEETKQALSGKSVVQTIQIQPRFSIVTAGEMLYYTLPPGSVYGLAGALSGDAFNSKQVKAGDPALIINNSLADKLQSKFSMVRQEQEISVVDMDDVNQLAAKFSNNDYVLDVQTVYWSAIYFPTNWVRYQVLYTARSRLIDTKQARVVAESGCARRQWPGSSDGAPTYDELLADDAARLKQTLAEHAESCFEEMSKQMFDL